MSGNGPARPERGFPKSRRLLTKRDFETVFREGRKVVRPSLVFYVRPLPEGAEPRVGFAVSRKVGKAVVRNRVKRRLREIFRLLAPGLRGGPAEVIVIARPGAAGEEYPALERQFHQALGRLGYLDDPGQQG